jgi:hypothetical protein
LRRALAILERQPRPDPPAIALALENLAVVYAEMGDARSAERARARLASARKAAARR